MTKPARYLIAKTVFLFVGSLGAAACSGGDEIKWTEEVKLNDGRVVQLKRRTEVSSSGFPAQQRGFRQYNEFCYQPMGVYWKSKAVYRPQIFDIVDGKAYVKVPITGCTECMLHEYPPTDALYFVWDGSGWRRIEASMFPSGLRLNLLSNEYSSQSRNDAQGLVSLGEKQSRDAALYYEMKVTGRSSPAKPGACERCKKVRVQTDQTAEVFIPSSRPSCDW